MPTPDLLNTFSIILTIICAAVFTFFLIRGLSHLSLLRAFKSLSNSFNSSIDIDESYNRRLINKKNEGGKYSFVSFVKNYQIYLLNGNEDDVKDIEKVNAILEGIISKEQEEAFYAGLDKSERQQLKSIEGLVHDKKYKTIIKENLRHLAESIIRKTKKFKQARFLNWVTIPLSVASFIFALIRLISGNKVSDIDREHFDEQFFLLSKKLDTLIDTSNQNTISFTSSNEETK